MPKSSRRTFLGKASVAATVATVGRASPASTALGANERFGIGVIGCGGRGTSLAKVFASQPGATVAYTCDPDRNRAERAKTASNAEFAVADMRRIFDDSSVDAVVIASCDHWHAPAAILAANAGKHVYVEKPCSHNVREGRLMVDAARENNIVMQHGTQSRSNRGRQEAVEMLREGVIGDVLIAKHVNSQRRANIGHRTPSDPPDHLDYDMWVGPAEWRALQSNFVHYHWHWFYNFGTGDIGNDGVHGIDVARWGLGVDTHPAFVTGYGSKLFFDDDQEFPDTYTITYEYPGGGKIGEKRLLIYEQRIWSPYRQDADGNSIFFYGTTGLMTIGHSGVRVFGQNNKLIKDVPYSPAGDEHQRDFLDAIKDRTRKPNADIEIGHLSSSLCHLGNIVSRVGRSVRFEPKTERISSDVEAHLLLRRKYREGHWAIPADV
ncbi:MAG: Gfo/Idh/MocA family oxidoreductase [Pirellulaceae bacterium]|nr:Gfo/Idh/MocA family oxidoreductase [Pirellulaceae bacterium]